MRGLGADQPRTHDTSRMARLALFGRWVNLAFILAGVVGGVLLGAP